MKRALLAVALLLAVAVPAAPSGASTYYDYWGYWHKPPGQTAWQYSKVGPSGYRLLKGSQVEGWRFGVGTASPSDPQPRPANISYDDHCTDTTSTYRVLLVVDYGTQSGAPNGPVYSCYGFNGDAPSGFDVLTKQHSERDSGGLICAIDGYPKSGCGDVVSSPAPKASRSAPTTTTSPAPTAPPSHRISVAPPPSTGPATTAPAGHGGTAPAATPRTTTSATGSVTPSPSGSTPVVATPFVAPRRHGGVPYGFVAACVFVVAVIGAVLWQQRRRAG